MYVVSTSKDYNGEVLFDIITVVILVPSGVNKFSFKVIQEKHVLSFSATWPTVLTNSKLLHKKWLTAGNGKDIAPYHPRIIGYQDAVESVRSELGDTLESTTFIDLPVQVLKEIRESHYLGFENDNTCVYYIDLTSTKNNQEVTITNEKPQVC